MNSLRLLLAQHRLLSAQLKEIEEAKQRVVNVAKPDRLHLMIQALARLVGVGVEGWRSMNNFQRPTPQEFDKLAHEQRLDDLRAHELRLVLYHVDEDLKEYRKRREGNQPIKTWFAVDRLNRGGRPTKNPARDLLLFRLAEAAPVVIGHRATATARGRFVRLCGAVVVACGLEDQGIERAVEKAIKELSKQQRKGFRRIPRPPATPTQTGSAKS
jgi:hypothetical protein